MSGPPRDRERDAAGGDPALADTSHEDPALGLTTPADPALDVTTPVDPALSATLPGDTTPPPTDGSPRRLVLTGRSHRIARAVLVTLMAAAAINLAYFVVRFVLAADPPPLHPGFRGVEIHDPGRFGPTLAALGGWRTTAARLLLVSTVLLVMPAVIAWRHPRNALVQAFAALSVVAGQLSLAVTVLTSGETIAGWRVLALAIYLLVPALGFTVLALSPSGKPVPRWSVWLIPPAWGAFAAQAFYMYATRDYSRPIAGAGMLAGFLFLGFQWYRYRRHATLRQRHQIKWLAYGGGAFLAIQVVAIGLVLPLLSRHGDLQPLYKLLYEVLIGGSYLAGIVIGLLSAARYRLWDIDRIINRTIVYAALSVVLGLFLVVVYVALRAALYDVLDATGPLAAGAALAVVVLAFAPLRRRITRFTDRRFYGIRIDYEALAARAAGGELPATGDSFAAYGDLELLGRGGMGAVYRANHPDFEVPVALKVMAPSLAGDARAQARFRREAQVLEGVRHPNVVPYLASGHDRGLAFIAMEYIDGEDLATLLARRGRLELADAVAILGGIARAIDAAHALGVVHRDLKPANILVAGAPDTPLAERRPMVMDFGVASWPEGEADGGEGNGALVGSLVYISPEQIRGATIDGRADVYSLGVTAFELVTGRPPFTASSALGLVMAHLNQPPPNPRALVPELSDHAAHAILRALAKRPDDRFDTASAFIDTLAES